MRIGAAVANNDKPQEMNDAKVSDGDGGSCRGEAFVNGMKDPRLGSRRELGIRCSCRNIANIRKCKVT